MAKQWQVYIIEADDGSLYTGVSTDVQRRFEDHLHRPRRGARFFRGRKPRRVVYVEDGHDRSSACRREAEIKQMTRPQKLELVSGYQDD